MNNFHRVALGFLEYAAIFVLDHHRIWAVGDQVGFGANDAVAIYQDRK